jgi:hypothetical protein
MGTDDPDVAALAARLGLKGLRYRSFGNRPLPDVPEHVAAPAARPDGAPPPAAPVPWRRDPPPAYPLLAAAIAQAAAPPAPPPRDATSPFLGLRAALAPRG